MANKIKYGIQNVYYAVITESTGTGGVITQSYGTPVAIPGAVSLSLDATGDKGTFFADNIPYWERFANNGYEGELEVAVIPDSFRTAVLGETAVSNAGLLETADAITHDFALLFQFEGDQKARRHVLYQCTASRPSVEGQTVEDTIEPSTETISISAKPNAARHIKFSTDDNTTDTVYNGFFSAVYVPTVTSGGSGD